MKVMKMKELCQRLEFMNSLMVMTKSLFSVSDHHTYFIYGILLTYMTYYIMYLNNFGMTVSVMDVGCRQSYSFQWVPRATLDLK